VVETVGLAVMVGVPVRDKVGDGDGDGDGDAVAVGELVGVAVGVIVGWSFATVAGLKYLAKSGAAAPGARCWINRSKSAIVAMFPLYCDTYSWRSEKYASSPIACRTSCGSTVRSMISVCRRVSRETLVKRLEIVGRKATETTEGGRAGD